MSSLAAINSLPEGWNLTAVDKRRETEERERERNMSININTSLNMSIGISTCQYLHAIASLLGSAALASTIRRISIRPWGKAPERERDVS